MGDFNNVNKICGFYVSGAHLVTSARELLTTNINMSFVGIIFVELVYVKVSVK
jgi:hypothetical protein